MNAYEVLVVGAGPAGLSATLVLGRCRRRVLLCDWGEKRNSASHAIHGLLSHEGAKPAQFIADGTRELARYPTIDVRQTEVAEIRPVEAGFHFRCADGQEGLAKKVLLATGLADLVPEIPGLQPLYGISVHHCLYCDGFENSGRPVAAYGEGDKGAGLALMIKHWTDDVVVLTGGLAAPSAEMQSRLAEHDIRVIDKPIAALEGADGRLQRIRFSDGSDLPRNALFFSSGCRQKSDLSRQLGCARDEKGGVITDAQTEETSVPGVFVAGDVSRDVLLVVVALAEGAKAAVAINRALLGERGLL